MNLGLEDKRVLVTGGTGGIGLALSKAFLSEGASVAMIARHGNRLCNCAEQLSLTYDSCRILPLVADCSKINSMKSAMSELSSVWEGLDVVVANVGDGRSIPDSLPNQDHFYEIWTKNFVTAELTAEFTLPFLALSRGCLLFISSIAGLEFIGAPTDYSVAKAAVIALSKQLAKKLAPEVRVNCIAPGNIYFQGGSWDEKIKVDPERIENLIQSTVPMKRFGSPEEIADLAVFLCSDRAKFITGSCVVADGGQTVGHF